MQRNAKITLIALIVVCTLPVIASYLAFYVWKPQDQVNYGQLIPPTSLPEVALRVPEGRPSIDRDSLNAFWTLVYVGAAACDEACRDALYATRQTRVAQGKELERVARLWLVSDDAAPNPDMLATHRDLQVAHADDAWLALLPGAELGVHVFLVDPLGNIMMRFPAQADIKRVIKDVRRLLKYSGLR